MRSVTLPKKASAQGIARLRHRCMAHHFLTYSTHSDPVESESVAEVSAISATFRIVEEVNFIANKRAYTVLFKVDPREGGRLEISNLYIGEYK
jgi:hypothetical protein